MTTLSSQPYKGTRDYYPEDKRVQNYIFDVWKKTVEKFGYEEYGAPMLEPLEVYTAKSGQELAGEQTYTFTDRGDRTVAIRPEMTPSISRMVAARRQELAYPARLYSIANFMRYERPQRGREREFWQLNVDIFGADSIQADAEIIVMADQIMKAYGAKPSMYAIKVNNRKLVDFMMSEYLGLDAERALQMVKLFDRKSKISPEEFTAQAAEIFGNDKSNEGLEKIAALVQTKNMADLPEMIRESEYIKETVEIFALLEDAGITNAIFDITLMRGFDYYTGTVFEVFDTHPENNRAMFGGGRYDGLVGLFGVEPLSAVGMAPGLTMTELFLRSHGLLPELPSATEIYMVVPEGDLAGTLPLAAKLRDEGVKVEVDITERKFDKQIKTALKKKIPYLLFVGEDDLKKKVFNFKETATSKEESLSFERVVSKVKDRRRTSKDDDIDSLL